jgi:hypothetical protein
MFVHLNYLYLILMFHSEFNIQKDELFQNDNINNYRKELFLYYIDDLLTNMYSLQIFIIP